MLLDILSERYSHHTNPSKNTQHFDACRLVLAIYVEIERQWEWRSDYFWFP